MSIAGCRPAADVLVGDFHCAAVTTVTFWRRCVPAEYAIHVREQRFMARRATHQRHWPLSVRHILIQAFSPSGRLLVAAPIFPICRVIISRIAINVTHGVTSVAVALVGIGVSRADRSASTCPMPTAGVQPAASSARKTPAWTRVLVVRPTATRQMLDGAWP